MLLLSLTIVLSLAGCSLCGSEKTRKYMDYNDIVLLASDVQHYYGTSSVFIVLGGNHESLDTTTLMLHLYREFSRKQVLSLIANYTDIIHYGKLYNTRIIKPLAVVLLRTEEDMRIFQLTTRACNMHSPKWLIIFMDSSIGHCKKPRGNVLNLRFDSRMLVKCAGDANLHEWWSVDGKVTEILDLALWDPINHLRLKVNNSLYERRRSIGGINLRVATVNGSPFTASQSGPTGGFFGQILQELSSAINFTYTYDYSDDSYGTWNKTTKRWSGAIGRLVNKQADIGVAEFTMTSRRLKAVDFTLPMTLTYNRLYMRQPDGSVVQWSSYHRGFHYDIWMILMLVYVSSSFIITVIRMKVKEKPIPSGHISENYLLVWGIFCQQGLSYFPSASPLRIAYFSVFLLALVILALYSACLISYLTIATPNLPFKDLKGFANDGSYKLIVFQESSHYAMFVDSNDSTLEKIMRLMKSKKELPATMMAGFKQVCSENKVAFYATEAVKNKINDRLPCELAFIESGTAESLGFVIAKGNPYKEILNFYLQKFQDFGIMMRLDKKFSQRVSTKEVQHVPVCIHGIVPLLTVLGVGVLLSFLIFLHEKLLHQLWHSLINAKIFKRCQSHTSLFEV